MIFILYKINRFFEIYFGWFFVNGNKIERWNRTVREKYNNYLTKLK